MDVRETGSVSDAGLVPPLGMVDMTDIQAQDAEITDVEAHGVEGIEILLAHKGYQVHKLIDSGGMGWVFEATQMSLQRRVAIKVMKPVRGADVLQDRFNQEAEIVAQLVHHNIVTLHDYGRLSPNNLFMVMEYLDGQNLAQRLEEEGPLDPALAVHIASQVGAALRCAHRHGVIHRDLKPDNIMLVHSEDEDDGRVSVKLVDFGLSKIILGNDSAKPLTTQGQLVGTPRYMAPEQIQGEVLDERVDIYALGAVLFHMLTGRPPFDSLSTIDQLLHHLNRPVPSLTESLAPNPTVLAVDGIIQRCMEKEPAARYTQIDGLLDAFARLPSPEFEEAEPEVSNTASTLPMPPSAWDTRPTYTNLVTMKPRKRFVFTKWGLVGLTLGLILSAIVVLAAYEMNIDIWSMLSR